MANRLETAPFGEPTAPSAPPVKGCLRMVVPSRKQKNSPLGDFLAQTVRGPCPCPISWEYDRSTTQENIAGTALTGRCERVHPRIEADVMRLHGWGRRSPGPPQDGPRRPRRRWHRSQGLRYRPCPLLSRRAAVVSVRPSTAARPFFRAAAHAYRFATRVPICEELAPIRQG